MRELSGNCGKHRVANLLRHEGLRLQTGHWRRPGIRASKPAAVAPSHPQRQFHVTQRNQVRVTDIADIRTHEGWLYLAVVVDLFSRHVVGWSMGRRSDASLVLQALVMAVWRLRPAMPVTVYSNQRQPVNGSRMAGFLRDHITVYSINRRGNCRDDAVAQSFFQILRREHLRRHTYTT